MKCKCVKKSDLPKTPMKAAAKGDPAPRGMLLVDNQDDTFTIMGEDDRGNTIDIDAVVSLSVSSDNTSVLTASAVGGAKGKVSAVAEGSAKVAIVATWADGSAGPFNIEEPIEVVKAPPGPVTKLKIEWGTPTVR